jgi:hypothetical protein
MNNLKNQTEDFIYTVQVDWENHRGTIWWNETCALVLEVFGLPGHRFIYKPSGDYMLFKFKSAKDESLCRILLSDRL